MLPPSRKGVTQSNEEKTKRSVVMKKFYQDNPDKKLLLKRAPWNKGKKLPNQSGENHPRWKGGHVKHPDKRIRRSKRYKEWRTSVYERDNYTCQECNKRGGKLVADHIKPFCLHPELRLELSNGRTLCEDCHKKTPTYGRTKNKQKICTIN